MVEEGWLTVEWIASKLLHADLLTKDFHPAVHRQIEALREVDQDEVAAQERSLKGEAAVLTSRGGVRRRPCLSPAIVNKQAPFSLIGAALWFL